MIRPDDPSKTMHGARAHSSDLVRRLAHLLGDMLVRFLLDVSHDQSLTRGLLQLTERIKGFPELF